MTDYYEVMEAGIDYVTISALPHQVAVIKTAATKLGGQRERLGDQGKPSSALGYDGIQVGPVVLTDTKENRAYLDPIIAQRRTGFALIA